MLAMKSSMARRRFLCFASAAIATARLVPVSLQRRREEFESRSVQSRPANALPSSKVALGHVYASVALRLARLSAVLPIAISATGLPRHPLRGAFGPA
jgi:hypothetical protein